jgi:hypothetical protein
MALAAGFSAGVTPSSRATGVRFVRPDLYEQFAGYNMIGHCLAGSEEVKKYRTTYLPMPDPSNWSTENQARYESYLTRAIFYNVTQRTALGLLGQIFMRPPAIEMPALLDAVKNDSNGQGIGIEQLAKDACLLNIGYGRLGMFTDYPPTEGNATVADLEKGNIRPTITIYKANEVINWRTKAVGSKLVFTLVVLEEEYTVEDDGFETVTALQYRELRLDAAGYYCVQLWRSKDPKGDNFEKYEGLKYPKDGKGNLITAIPFTFVGSKNNEPSIDPAPLKDLANINIGHYRNSADYEEMIYILGQPMLVITGLDEHWYKEVLNSKIPFGSRNGLPLPKDCTAEIIQVDENTAAKEGMEHKERQMVALGAKIVEQKEVQRTATEAGMENAAEESTLVSIAKNVSAAIQWSLEWCAVFANVPESSIKFELNTDFEMARMTPEEVNATIKSWQDEAISWTELRTILRKAGRATQDDETAKAEIEGDAAKAIERAAAEMAATTKATSDNLPPAA